jgi:hypothetical protein
MEPAKLAQKVLQESARYRFRSRSTTC